MNSVRLGGRGNGTLTGDLIAKGDYSRDMEIGLIYSNQDPQQFAARNFVHRFIRERGILANIVESEQPVSSPTIIINGRTLTDLRQSPRESTTRMFPNIDDIARALEQHFWSL